MKRSMAVMMSILVLFTGVAFAAAAPGGDTIGAPGQTDAPFLLPQNAIMLEKSKGEITTLQSAAVKLESNATTGYSWECKISNTKVLQLVDSTYQTEGAEGVVGAGGYQYFVFEPLKAGTVKLTFSYIQAGSTKAEKKQVITLKVTRAYSGTKELAPKTSLRVGEDATITLDANATTGYEWSAELSKPNILAVKKDMYNAPDEKIPGAGGSHSFSFQALKKGKCVVTLTYKRSFEDTAAEIRKYTVTVK